jgi:crossover junction endodeoxyribonuclease RuvC
MCPILDICSPPPRELMRVFGIDPGSTATGYAIVERTGGRFVLLDAGVIRTKSSDPIPHRLRIIHHGLNASIMVANADCVSIESIFRHRSSESALRLGQARGVALLAAAQHDLEVFEYNAMTVKKTVGGHGRAGKPEVARIVAQLVGGNHDLASDASDAAAIAITHLMHRPFQRTRQKRRAT